MRRSWVISAGLLTLVPVVSLAAGQNDAAFRGLTPVERVGTFPVQVEGGITDDDYPPEAIRANQTGTTTAKFIVSTNGRVPVCEIENSSRWDMLDQRTCDIIKDRFRYVPAKDKKGRPVAYALTQRVTWQMPKGDRPLPELMALNVEIELIVSPEGIVKSCRALKFENVFNRKPEDACAGPPENRAFQPFEGAKDKRVMIRNTVDISDVE